MSTISRVEFDLSTLKTYNETTQAFEDAELKGSLYTVAGVTDATGALRRLSMAELVMVVCLARAAEKERAVVELMKEMGNTTDTLNALTDIEVKLLDGQSIDTITGNYSYQGRSYSRAVDFLNALDGNISSTYSPTLAGLYNTLNSGVSVFTLTDSYEYNGTTYDSAYELLQGIGALDGSLGGLPVYLGYEEAKSYYERGNEVIPDSELINLTPYYSNVASGMTGREVGQKIEAHLYTGKVQNYLEAILNGYSYSSSTTDYAAMSTDELITHIEGKMDSMNSFSQQKMIELQSETNKRDQAYDMITNILKSMHTVQVGIVNNM